jgi:acetate kinase
MMGTRSGSIDPGILTYLMRQHQVTAEQMDELLNQQSGLLGISGVSGDMREIRAAMERGHARAKLAFEMYAHRLQSYIGAMIAVLGGIDALVFSAGVGENSPEVRAAACEHFAFAGLALDPEKNLQAASDTDISAPASNARVLVVHAEEEWCIARECWKIAGAKASC